MPDPTPPGRGFLSRSTLALAFAVYGWSMMGVELYLAGAPLPEGPDRGLTLFRREVMGRAVVGLGGAAIVTALILAALGLRAGRHRRVALAALALSAAWILCLAKLWPM